MGFSQELRDFTDGFRGGYELIKSPAEKEAEKQENRWRTARANRAEYEMSPKFLETEMEGLEANVESTKAGTALTTEKVSRAKYENTDEYRQWERTMQESDIKFQNEQTKQLAFKNSPQFQELLLKQGKADLAKTEADTVYTTEAGRKLASENRISEIWADAMKDITGEQQGKISKLESAMGEPVPAGAPVEEAQPEAVPTEEPSTHARERERDTSAVEVPASEVEEPAVPEVEPARPIEPVSEPARGPQVTAPAPQSAVEAGDAAPRVHPNVINDQQAFDAQTVNALDFAGSQTGIVARPRSGPALATQDTGVLSGVELLDAETGQVLNQSHPNDAARIRDFTSLATQAYGGAPAPAPVSAPASGAGAGAPVPAVPTGAGAGAPAPAGPVGPTSERGRPGLFEGGSVYDSALEASRVGLEYIYDQAGVNMERGVETPEDERRIAEAITGTSDASAPKEQVDEAEDTVQAMANKLGYTLSPDQKVTFAIATVYESYMRIGEPEKAQKAAAAMIGHYQKMFNQWTAIAQAAAMDGDIDGATEAAAKAYANVPDGYSVKFDKVSDTEYLITQTNDETGEQSFKKVLHPDQIGALAMEMNPNNFVEALSRAAGIKDETMSGAEAQALAPQLGLTPEQLDKMTLEGAGQYRLAQTAKQEAGYKEAEEGRNVARENRAITKFGREEREAATKTAQEAEDRAKTEIKDEITEHMGELTTEELGIVREQIPEVLNAALASPDYGRVGEFINDGDDRQIRQKTDTLTRATQMLWAQNNQTFASPEEAIDATMELVRPTEKPVLPVQFDDKNYKIQIEGYPELIISKDRYFALRNLRNRFVEFEKQAATGNGRPGLGEFVRSRVNEFREKDRSAVPGPAPQGRAGQPMQTLETPVTRQGERSQAPVAPRTVPRIQLDLSGRKRRQGGSGSRTGR